MFDALFARRALLAAVLCGVCGWTGALPAQEAPKKGGAVPITFLPPPVENATYSVGIYDAKTGKLARRLCEAAGQDTFKVGLNGLITSWDGRDDDGKPLPPGRYAARGYAVGPLEVEGVDILGNDWAQDDESLRVRNVEAIAAVPDDEGLAAVFNVGADRWVVARFKGKDGALLWQKPVAIALKPATAPGAALCRLDVAGSALTLIAATGERAEYRLADGQSRVLPKAAAAFNDGRASSLGRNESVWVIEDGVLSERSMSGDVLRSLAPQEGEPLPVAVSASTKSERLYLLEQKEGWQRVRGLAWVDTTQQSGKPVSTWQTFFERDIRKVDPLAAAGATPAAKAAAPMVEISLDENPLQPGKAQRLSLAGTFDEKGSYLSTADGLRLRLISQRTGLHAARLVEDKAGGSLKFYQDDGAAWDEFAVRGARKIVSFDAGEFEINAAGEKPVTEKAPDPEL